MGVSLCQKMKTLNKYKENIYSQNGEDGIIKEINKRLGITKGWFVEFGAWDGKHLSNCYNLAKQGWNGVYIESDKRRFKDLENTSKELNKNKERIIIPINSTVTSTGESSLDNILSKATIPKDFDLLSIDIDSYDYWIWREFIRYKPKVVIVEINSYFGSKKEHININGVSYLKPEGTSFLSMLLLGIEKGYKLVCHTGNMIFVRKDLVNKLKIPSEELFYPTRLFSEPKLTVAKILFKIKDFIRGEFKSSLGRLW